MAHMFTEEELENSLQILKLLHEERDFRRMPTEVEANMLDTVRQGRYQDFKVSPYEKIRDSLGTMVENPMTDYTYMVVSAITLFSRIALEEGLNPDDVYDLSDMLLLNLSDCTTLKEIQNLYQLSGVMFARRIHKHKNASHTHSRQTEKALTYISQHIFQKITLEELADYAGLSVSHISRMFTQEMGISIHNYIQREKTAVACNLLMHTDRPISEIATYMGFQTPSNFALVFRKWQKMSPTEYRARMYREVY